ncbi:MAG: LysR family transcriptional regulator [Pseudomonadota bacterium]
MDRFSDLELFMLVVRRGNLTGAAQELGMTGAAVSKRLSALERRLGARLVQRTTRRLSVTAEGERYLAQGSAIVSALEELEDGLRGTVAQASGLLRVNASLGFGRRCIAPALADFARAQPAVEVQLHLSDRPLNLVEHGFDVGIRVGELADDRTSARRLLANRRVLCASPTYLARRGTPERVTDLARHHAIVLRENDETYGTWHLHAGPRSEVAKVRGSMNTNDGEVAVQWALDGFGLLLRSEWDVEPYLREDRLRVVLPEWSVPADVHAVYPTRDQLSARTRAFVDFLVTRFAPPV